MTTKEAIQAMLDGKKVCRYSWGRNSGYIYFINGCFADEKDDVILADLSGDDWEIYEEEKQTVTIEKWLCYKISEQEHIVFDIEKGITLDGFNKVKLLDIYEVEI